jgi:AraC family transcriptional activator of mtrCDE
MFNLPSSAHMALGYFPVALDIGVTNFAVCDIRDGSGMRFDACKTASLHYCLEGVGALAVHGAEPIQLEPHTFVLLPPRVA